jgi:hypothetical protein
MAGWSTRGVKLLDEAAGAPNLPTQSPRERDPVG